MMEDRVKAWIEKEYEYIKRYGDNCDAKYATERCLGAVMFALNELNCPNALGDWWDDEMLPKFRKLIEED